MKKKLAFMIVSALCMAFILCGCCISHNWQDATCEAPKTCTKCGTTEGEALGHSWQDATCEAPKTCTTCGEIDGSALGHYYERVECGQPEKCSVCGKNGEIANHDAPEATCTEDAVCNICKQVAQEATGHDWKDATVNSPKTCRKCGETEGAPLPYSYFDMSFTEFKKRFNKLSPGNMILTTYDGSRGGWPGIFINIPDLGITANGKKEILVFNQDTSIARSGAVAGETEELKKFNKLIVRYLTPAGNGLDTTDIALIWGIELQIGSILDKDFDQNDAIENVETDQGNNIAILRYSKNGINYYIRCEAKDRSNWYELTVTLAANS